MTYLCPVLVYEQTEPSWPGEIQMEMKRWKIPSTGRSLA